MDFGSTAVSNVIALLAFGLAFYSAVRSWLTDKALREEQRKLLAVQLKLSELQLGREIEEEENKSKAMIAGRFIKNKSDRFVVENTGLASAHNIQIEFVDKDDFLIEDPNRHFAEVVLHSGESHSFLAAFSLRSAGTYKIVFTWKNPDGSKGTNEQTLKAF